MLNEVAKKVIEIFKYNNSWEMSYFKKVFNDKYARTIKYFSLKFDSRTMDPWLITFHCHTENFSFRIDDSLNINKLIEFLNIINEEDVSNKEDYFVFNLFELNDYVFRFYRNKNEENQKEYFVTKELI